jgi:predicted nucleotidyltransferase
LLEAVAAIGYPLDMVSRQQILSFVRKVAKEFSPERIILFGSYANGCPTEDSDVDLLVIMEHKKRNIEQALEITNRIDRSFPLDLIVRTPQETRRRIKQSDMFLLSLLNEGETVYARNHRQGMGRKSGRRLRNSVT